MNKEEIIKAIQIIKKYCKKNKTCKDCMLRNKHEDGCTGSGMYIPRDWKIK